MIEDMKTLLQILTMILGAFMIFKGTANAKDGVYSLEFKEAGIEPLSAQFIYHSQKPTGDPDSKEMKVIWTQLLSDKHSQSKLKMSGLMAMDDVTGRLQQDLRAQASLQWDF